MDIPPYEAFMAQIKINFLLTGIPYDDPKIYLRFYILLSLIIIMVLMEISYIISKISSENFLDLTQLTPCTCIGILSILKIVAVTYKRINIFRLIKNLNPLYDQIFADCNKRQLIKHDLLLLRMLVKYFFLLNITLICVYNFLSPALMLYNYLTKKTVVFLLPYAVLLPFSTDTWMTWVAVYLFSIICGFICVLYFTTVDSLYFVLTSHVCSNFRIISDAVYRLNELNENTLREVVKSHQYILKLAEELEDIFAVPNLFNMLIGSLEICALGFNLTFGSWQQFPGNILFISSAIMQILMMCVFGENIINESKKIGDAAYHCKWYTMSTKAKKTILTIIIRSNKPQRLTAYKFSTISYQSFTKIISTSWSYFTILKTVYKPPGQNMT